MRVARNAIQIIAFKVNVHALGTVTLSRGAALQAGWVGTERPNARPTTMQRETRTQCIRVEPLRLVWPLLFQIVRHLWCLAT
jgi:hypothetical protein